MSEWSQKCFICEGKSSAPLMMIWSCALDDGVCDNYDEGGCSEVPVHDGCRQFYLIYGYAPEAL